MQHSLSQPESFIVVPNSPFKIDPRSVSSKDISLIPTYYIPRFLSINWKLKLQRLGLCWAKSLDLWNSSGSAGGIYPRVLFPGRGACSVFSVYHSRKSARPVNRRVNSTAASCRAHQKNIWMKSVCRVRRGAAVLQCCRVATNLNTHPAPAVPASSRCRVTPSEFCILL